MRVICDKCGASYKISDDRLTRDVNKATCRKCGEPIYIRRPNAEAAAPGFGPAWDQVTGVIEMATSSVSPAPPSRMPRIGAADA